MNDEKILEAIEKVIAELNFREGHEVPVNYLATHILDAIKPLLPPTDLVKVWEGKTYLLRSSNWKGEDAFYKTAGVEKHIEVYIREVK